MTQIHISSKVVAMERKEASHPEQCSNVMKRLQGLSIELGEFGGDHTPERASIVRECDELLDETRKLGIFPIAGTIELVGVTDETEQTI